MHFTDAKNWDEFDAATVDERAEIKRLAETHGLHCANRQVWGDGECECDMYKQGYNPYAWMEK